MCTIVRPYLKFCFPQFQLLAVNHSLKMLNGKFQKFTGFKLCAILSSMMKSCAIQLHLAQDVNHSFAHCLRAVYAPHPLVT